MVFFSDGCDISSDALTTTKMWGVSENIGMDLQNGPYSWGNDDKL